MICADEAVLIEWLLQKGEVCITKRSDWYCVNQGKISFKRKYSNCGRTLKEALLKQCCAVAPEEVADALHRKIRKENNPDV